MVNWDQIFQNKTGSCSIQVKLISKKGVFANLPWDTTIGTLRCNLGAPFSNNNNGVVLGHLTLEQESCDLASNVYLSCDTTMNNSNLCVSIPKGQTEFVLQICNINETLNTSSTLTDYQITLFFNVQESNQAPHV
jgi:hypothetical protein